MYQENLLKGDYLHQFFKLHSLTFLSMQTIILTSLGGKSYIRLSKF